MPAWSLFAARMPRPLKLQPPVFFVQTLEQLEFELQLWPVAGRRARCTPPGVAVVGGQPRVAARQCSVLRLARVFAARRRGRCAGNAMTVQKVLPLALWNWVGPYDRDG